ncbi:uncharacterized protein [Porites lutea]|uniref:uncharacterized protein n=1 Tax=Porites lutea TaxID=51062 RepID=UPI003CC5F58A
MGVEYWILLIVFIGCYKRSGQTCPHQPRVAFAVDSSQSISNQEFKDQLTLVTSIVTNSLTSPKDVAIALYNTQVRVNITFDRFNSFTNLRNAISDLPLLDSAKDESDLVNLFNTKFTKLPEVFMMIKKERNATYSAGFKIPDGRLGNVKKIAVTFGVKSNIGSIADFHRVFQYKKSEEFNPYSQYSKISKTLCYALVSPSTSVPKTENSPKQPVGTSSDLPSYILNSVPYDITSTLATGMNYSALKSPLMTASPLTASYILSTQNGFNETNDSLPTIKRTSSLILATYASHMTYSGQGKTSLSKGRVSLSIKPSQKASTKPSSLLVMSKKRDLPQTVNTETQGFLRTRKWSSSFLQTTCASHMTPYPAQGKTFPSITPSLEKSTRPSSTISVSSQEGDLSDTTNLLPSSVKIVPSTAVKELITQTVNSSIEVKNDDFIDKLLRDRHFILNFNSNEIATDNKTLIQDYFNKAASLLRYGDFLDNALNSSQQLHELSTCMAVLHALERFTAMVGHTLGQRNASVLHSSYFAGGLVCHIFVVQISTFEGIQLGSLDADNSTIIFPRGVFGHMSNKRNETGVLITLVFDPFQQLRERGAFPSFGADHYIVSKIVNAFTRPPPLYPLPRPIQINLRHFEDAYHEPHCVFWDYTNAGISAKFGKWSRRGCRVFYSNDGFTECHCDHMTNYAVLMRVKEQVLDVSDEFILTVITYIGCSVSIFSAFLTVITFLSLPIIKSEITKIHLNLSIAVGIAQVLFLAAGSEKLVGKTVICKLYTGLSFYFFMSVFTWMFVEGVHLYQMIVIAFVSRSMMKFYVALGWGLPACAVVIASSIAQDGFGTPKFCWLSSVGGAIWGFVGPAVAVIGINLFVLVRVLCVRVNINKEEGTKAQLRTTARVSPILLPLLGISWVFGVFAVNDDTVVFQYIFTISNSIQGLLIFAFHCAGNSEVRHEFQRKASHLSLMRGFTSPSSPTTIRMSRISQQDFNKKKNGWVGGKL